MVTRLPPRIENVVIGAGQAGLVMSWHLQRAGRDHVVLERRSTLGGGWQDRWDAFRLVGPNWTTSLPGAPYDGDDKDGFMPRDEVAARMARYASTIGAPAVLEAGVERLRPAGDGWLVETTQGPLEADSVIVATGGFHRPFVPAMAGALPRRIHQLHAHHYRQETDLPPGAVLIVGTGQTGVQLAEELSAAGREVYVCVGSAGRVPRRYRGRDIFYWLWRIAEDGQAVGAALPTASELPASDKRLLGNAQLSGHAGGHEPDLRGMAREGVMLLGHLEEVEETRCRLAGDLHQNLAAADRFFDERFRDLIDAFIEAAGEKASEPEPRPASDHEPRSIEELDLDAAGITTVLWTSGYRQDLSWIDAPVTDDLGFPMQDRGVGALPGLYFIGGLWQHDQTSATLVGVARDARVLADRMGLQPN